MHDITRAAAAAASVALSAWPAGSALAQANGVTVYGIADAAVTSTSTGAPGVGRVKGLSSGVMSASRWGFRGREDLGGGWAASFVLEGGIDLDTGLPKNFNGNYAAATPTAPNGPVGTGWNRRSTVSLEGPFGSVALGRDYTPVFWAGAEIDALRYTLFGNLQESVALAGGSERWARVSNGIFYASPLVAEALRVRVAYSFGSEGSGTGGSTPPKNANEFGAIGLEYATKAFAVIATHQQLRLPVTGGSPAVFTGALLSRKDSMLGGRVAFGPVTVTGGAWRIDQPQDAGNDFFGLQWAAAPQLTVLAQAQRLRQDNPAGERKAQVLAAGATYALSRRTTLYASYGRVRNDGAAAFPLVSSDTSVAAGAPGADPSGLALGVRHTF